MGAGVHHLSSLHALQSLSMRDCKAVMGEAFASFSEMRHLRSLNLAKCVNLSLNGAPASSGPAYFSPGYTNSNRPVYSLDLLLCKWG